MNVNHLLLFLLMSLHLCLPLHGQTCTEIIPAAATVIDVDGPFNGPGTLFWVCSSTDVTFNNTFGIVHVEEDCNIVINSIAGGIYYVKGGGSVTINASGVQLTHGPGTVIVNTSGTGNITPCSSFDFDYSTAPAEGCDISTGLTEASPNATMVFPVPATSALQLSDMTNVASVRLVDRLGRTVKEMSAPFMHIPVDGLVAGWYILEVRRGAALSTHRVLVE